MLLRAITAQKRWLCVLLICCGSIPAYAQDTEENQVQWWGKTKADQIVNKQKTLEASIQQITNPSSDEMQEKAIYQLEKLGGEAVPSLLEIILAPEGRVKDRVQMDAIYAAGRIGAPAVATVPGIITALKSENPDKRAIAARALGRMGIAAQGATGNLAELLGDKLPFVRESAYLALQGINTASARRAIAVHDAGNNRAE